MEEFGHVVVRLDLDRMRVEDGTETFLDDLAGEVFPVEVGIAIR